MLRRCACVFALLLLSAAFLPAGAAEFPFGSELMLDTSPPKGTKRVPMIQIEEDGTASIDLWCGSVRAQATVGDDGTTVIAPGQRDNGQCDPERVAGDDDILDMIVHVTNWRRHGEVVEFSGPATLRFRLMTN
jgi:hypothetical protein